jgi:hypothetical protein
METILFIGNGINRLQGTTDYSWEQVLKELALKVKDESVLELKEEKPFTLIYEALRTKLFKQKGGYDYELKNHVATTLGRMTPNAYHNKFLNIGVRHILTPNYDYSFENSMELEVPHSNISRETRYSAFRRTLVGSTYIWHIHGEIEVPESIMLGFEHYGGYLQKIRSHIIPPKKPSSISKGEAKKRIRKKQHVSWVDLFLKSDVHILGFSMDYSEIDIWWLLSFKAQYEAKYKMHPSRTFYHSWSNINANNKEKAKLQLLESLGVQVYQKYEIGSYQECYDSFIDSFKSGLYDSR